MKKTLSLILALMLVMLLSTGTVLAKTDDDTWKNSKTKSVDTIKQKSKQQVEFKAQTRGQLQAEKKNQAQKQVRKSVQEAYQAYFAQKPSQAKTLFTDVNQHWAAHCIQEMTGAGLFKGYPDGTFKPDQKLIQIEALVLAVKISAEDTTAAASDDGTTINDANTQLSDVPAWAREDAGKAARKGIIKWNRFHSAVQASRAQTAVMIAKALGLEPVEITMPFKDGILISSEDAGYILALYQEGIISGLPNGNFNPNSAITRAEMASILQKLLQKSEITSVSLAETATVEQGKSITLNATVKYSDGSSDHQVSWSSSDTSLATVEDGVVSASVYKVGTVNITATATRGESTQSADCKVTIVAASTAGTLEDTGNVGAHDGKVYAEYIMKANGTAVSLAQDKVKSITLQKEGSDPVQLSANTDSSLWFNVQHETGTYTLKVIDTNNQSYTATINWTAPRPVSAVATGFTRQRDANTYAEYELGDLDLSSFTCMYQIKPGGQVIELIAQTDSNLWIQTNNQTAGKNTFLIKKNGIWYSASITL